MIYKENPKEPTDLPLYSPTINSDACKCNSRSLPSFELASFRKSQDSEEKRLLLLRNAFFSECFCFSLFANIGCYLFAFSFLTICMKSLHHFAFSCPFSSSTPSFLTDSSRAAAASISPTNCYLRLQTDMSHSGFIFAHRFFFLSFCAFSFCLWLYVINYLTTDMRLV